MKKVSKGIAALLCGAMIAAAGSCSTGSGPMVINGQELRAGIYILKQQAAVNEALTKLKEEQPDLDTTPEHFDFLGQTVEGKSFAQWVYDKTIEGCKEYVAVEQLFADNNLTLGPEVEAQIDSYINSVWGYSLGDKTYGETFEHLGVSQQSYKEAQLGVQKEGILFDYLYSTGGPNAVSDEELNAKIAEKYVGINYISYKLENGTPAQEYADMIKNGETFEEVYQKYYKEEYSGEEYVESGSDSAYTYNVQLPETDSMIHVMTREDTYPSGEMVAYAFDNMSVGDVAVVNVTDSEEDTVFIVQKVDLSTRPNLTSEYTSTIRHELKDDEFDEYLKNTYSSYSVNEGSTRSDYKLEKMLYDE